MRVLQDQRIECLVDRLAASLRQDPLPPLETELILVESVGMARWLPLQLATRNGVLAGAHFPFVGNFLWEQLLKPRTGSACDGREWNVGPLAWRIASLLPALVDRPTFAPVGNWLRRQQDERARLDLARQLATLFDQYLVYRPAWLLEWEGRKDLAADAAGQPLPREDTRHLAWQRELWQELRSSEQAPHRALLQAEWINDAAASRATVGGLKRISLFAPSSLPPEQLRLLSELSRQLPVTVYQLNPSRDYWSHLPESQRLRKRGVDPVAGHLETDPRLLALNGRERAEWIELLIGADADLETPSQVEPETGSALKNLRAGLIRIDAPAPRLEPDDSLRLYSCHSLARQLEVLHDRICQLFATDESLQPDDVLVLLPDLETAKSTIESVWGAQPRELQIPWRILGSPGWKDSQGLCLLNALDIPIGRWTLSSVLRLLDCPALRRRFGFGEEDPERLGQLLSRAGIRWGLDTASRRDQGLEATDEHSWSQGIDRLLLGQAMLDGEAVGGRLPLDHMSSEATSLLEGLLELLAVLEPLRSPRPQQIDQWKRLLLETLDRLFAPEGSEELERDHLSGLIQTWADDAMIGGWKESVSLEQVRRDLETALASREGIRGGGFDGRVCFAPMLAARGIPARIIALLDMNDGLFPRARARDELDLSLSRPLPGDRNPREQDRALFLDTLFSARETLLICYTGRDQAQNTHRPPSVCVAELREALGWGDDSVIQAPLQPFSHRHFRDSEPWLHSPDRERYRAARALAAKKPGGSERRPPISASDLPLPVDVQLDELDTFFRNPARALLRDRLGCSLPHGPGDISDEEPLLPTGLEAWQLNRRCADLLLSGMDLPAVRQRLKQEGLLGWGPLAELQLRKALSLLGPAIQALGDHLARAADTPRESEISLELGGFRIRGQLDGCTASGRHELILGKPGFKHMMGPWIRHLVLCLQQPQGVAPVTHIFGPDGARKLAACSDAEQLLGELLAAWHQGQSRWLPWIPGVSQSLASKLARQDQPSAGSNWFQMLDHEHDDPWLRIIRQGEDWRDHLPVVDSMCKVVTAIGLPLFEELS